MANNAGERRRQTRRGYKHLLDFYLVISPPPLALSALVSAGEQQHTRLHDKEAKQSVAKVIFT
ncbi:hypothetical protein [Sodalis sp.]|uniref:hypothetical protein n=1 Tax=Sodalis sp. (in: enterobacteria) TaxID=1898979 RepID=UPI003872FE86